jgi:imidazolonepropionase-like amidohydrolase
MTGTRAPADSLRPLATAAQGSDSQVFSGATLVQEGAVLRNAVLVVRDGRIESVQPGGAVAPAGVKPVLLTGKYLLPGLISTHVHISDVDGLRARAYTDDNTVRQLGVFARYGITTVLSLGGEQDPAFRARDVQAAAPLNRARLYLSGPVIAARTPADGRKMVGAVAARKPDIIKIRVDDNLGATAKMPPEVYRAIIDQAHGLGLRVAAHIFYLEDAKDLLRAGVDMIAHSVRDKDLDDEFIALMRARDVPYCPTLTRELSTFVYESTPAFFSDEFFLREADRGVIAQLQEPKRQGIVAKSSSAQAYKAALAVARRNLKKAADAGLLVVMGTDAGPFPERFQGYFEHLEMEMMAESGLTPAQVIRSATSDAARALKLNGVGTLTKGSWADFVVMERNPLEDIRHTRSISGVWIAGQPIKR